MSKKSQSLLALAFCVYAVSTLISMALMSVAAGLLILALIGCLGGPVGIIHRLREGLKGSDQRKYFWISSALTVVCLASLIYGLINPLSYGGRFSKVHPFADSLKLWYLFWPLVMVAGLRTLSPKQLETVLKSWLIAFGVLCIIAVYQHFTGWPRPQVIPFAEKPIRYHATLFLGHHLSVASILIFPLFAALDFLKRGLSSDKTQSPFGWSKYPWGAICALGILGLFLTYSRTLWVALPIGLLVWAFLNIPKKWAVILGVAVVLGMIGASRLPKVQERFHNTLGLTTREDLWMANFEFLEERPLLGVGWKHNQELSGYYLMQKYPGQEVFSGHAHNSFIDMLGGTGILGALAWVVWCGFVIYLTIKSMRNTQWPGSLIFASGLFCAWMTFHLNGLTQVNFWDAKVTHQMMWMVAWSLLWREKWQPQS